MNDALRKTTMKKLGRLPKPDATVRSHRVVTFVTEAERRRLQDLENQSGKSPSAVVHELIAQKLTQRP